MHGVFDRPSSPKFEDLRTCNMVWPKYDLIMVAGQTEELTQAGSGSELIQWFPEFTMSLKMQTFSILTEARQSQYLGVCKEDLFLFSVCLVFMCKPGVQAPLHFLAYLLHRVTWPFIVVQSTSRKLNGSEGPLIMSKTRSPHFTIMLHTCKSLNYQCREMAC